MSPEELKGIIETVIKNESNYFILYLILAVIITLLSSFTIEFFKGKGKNAASKQDIEELTAKVEEVKSNYIKQLEMFRGGQRIKNEKMKELYDKTIKFKIHLLEFKNDSMLNSEKVTKFFNSTKSLMFSIDADVLFNKKLQSELKTLEKDYNSWMEEVRKWSENPEYKSHIEIDSTYKVIDRIQEKILEIK